MVKIFLSIVFWGIVGCSQSQYPIVTKAKEFAPKERSVTIKEIKIKEKPIKQKREIGMIKELVIWSVLSVGIGWITLKEN